MSDQTSSVSELEKVAEDAEDATAVLEAESSDDLNGTSEDNSDEESRDEQRKKSAEGQIKKAQKLLEEGKPLPPSMKWTMPHLRVPLSDAKTAPADFDAKAIKEELKDDLLFDQKHEEYKKLPKEVRELIKNKFELYKAKGFKKGEALAELLSFVAVKTENSDRKKVLAAMPSPSGVQGEVVSVENYGSLPEKDRLTLLKAMVGHR